jgi:hypothetical protein
MEINKTFVAFKLNEEKEKLSSFSHKKISQLIYGEYSEIGESELIKTGFETEQAALEYAYKMDKYADWLILPKISFNNF